MMIQTCSVSFSFIVCKCFFKMATKILLKKLHPPRPRPLTFRAYPPTRWFSIFFYYQSDRKGCKRDYLFALCHFICFRAGCNHSRGQTRVKLNLKSANGWPVSFNLYHRQSKNFRIHPLQTDNGKSYISHVLSLVN